jgi:hypothetical protein
MKRFRVGQLVMWETGYGPGWDIGVVAEVIQRTGWGDGVRVRVHWIIGLYGGNFFWSSKKLKKVDGTL